MERETGNLSREMKKMKLDNTQTQSQIPEMKDEDEENQTLGEALTTYQLLHHQTAPVSDDIQSKSSIQIRGNKMENQTGTSSARIMEEKT